VLPTPDQLSLAKLGTADVMVLALLRKTVLTDRVVGVRVIQAFHLLARKMVCCAHPSRDNISLHREKHPAASYFQCLRAHSVCVHIDDSAVKCCMSRWVTTTGAQLRAFP
jgi:hypothetical protein